MPQSPLALFISMISWKRVLFDFVGLRVAKLSVEGSNIIHGKVLNMGTYNRVHFISKCSKCGTIIKNIAQYKHGYMRTIDYVLFETIENDNYTHRAVVEAILEEPCSHCGHEDKYELYIVKNRLEKILPTQTSKEHSGEGSKKV